MCEKEKEGKKVRKTKHRAAYLPNHNERNNKTRHPAKLYVVEKHNRPFPTHIPQGLLEEKHEFKNKRAM